MLQIHVESAVKLFEGGAIQPSIPLQIALVQEPLFVHATAKHLSVQVPFDNGPKPF